MGTCERSKGECTCAAGFEGHACERMACPGIPACSGHGKCLTISHLAELSENNGDVMDITYGMVPNKPATWDFEKIQGCYCDEGYEGYDCSLRSCPVGDDPRTVWHTARTEKSRMMLVKGKYYPVAASKYKKRGYDKKQQGATLEAEEIQAITCTALADGKGQRPDATFRLSFRCGKYNNVQSKDVINPSCTTDPIPWNAKEEDIKRALEKLKTIGGGEHQSNHFDSGKVEVHFTEKWSMETSTQMAGAYRPNAGKPRRGHWTPAEIAAANVACTADGRNVIVVQFKSEYGDLPALKASHSTFPTSLTLKVDTDGKGVWSQRGNKEKKECSGRGLCDYATGQCICAAGYMSSDGFNHVGSRRDCGHVIEIIGGEGSGASF